MAIEKTKYLEGFFASLKNDCSNLHDIADKYYQQHVKEYKEENFEEPVNKREFLLYLKTCLERLNGEILKPINERDSLKSSSNYLEIAMVSVLEMLPSMYNATTKFIDDTINKHILYKYAIYVGLFVCVMLFPVLLMLPIKLILDNLTTFIMLSGFIIVLNMARDFYKEQVDNMTRSEAASLEDLCSKLTVAPSN